MNKEIKKRTITRRLDAVLDGLDETLEGLYTKSDVDRVINRLISVGSKSNRPSVLRVLFNMFDSLGIEYEKGMDNQYYIDLVNSSDIPAFEQIEEKFIYALYSVYDKYLSPEDYMLRIVEKLSSDDWNEDSLRVRILKQFIKYGNFLSDAKFGGKRYIQDYVKEKCNKEKIDKDEIVNQVDDGVFAVLESAEKSQKKPDGKYGLLKLCDDLAGGKFRTGGATKKGLYLFAMVYGMTYYAGDKEFDETQYSTDIELNLFCDYYANNLMRFLTEAYNGKLCEYELDPSGQGINYKNFAEIIYIYYLASPYSSEKKIKKASEMIDEVASSSVTSPSNIVEEKGTAYYKNKLYASDDVFCEDLLKLSEEKFKEYVINNYDHSTKVIDDVTGKTHVVGVMQLETEQNTAFNVYKQLLEDLTYEGLKLENCNYGLWFADVAEFKKNGTERLLQRYPALDKNKLDDFIDLLLGVNSFLGYTADEKDSNQNEDQEHSEVSRIKTKALYVSDSSNISRTSIIVAYYYYYNAVNLDADSISSFKDHFSDFKQGLDELLNEAYYQPFSGKNIFDVLVAFSSYAYLSE